MITKLMIFFLFTLISLKSTEQLNERFKLERVLIFSRHNIRTPTNNSSKITSKKWPHWVEKTGYLTAKGALLEGYMGEYFAKLLRKDKILNNACPTDNDLFIYANNAKQRTIESAKAFAEKGFPGCDLKVYLQNTTVPDPVFNAVIHNSTKEFERIAFVDMEEKLSKVNVTSLYEKLNVILDVKNSPMCIIDKQCDLAKDKTIVQHVVVGDKPSVKGPLKLSYNVADAFLMEYYDGKPLNEVAWGNVKTEDELGSFFEITKEYLNVIFNTTAIAKDIAQPLLKCIRDILKNKSGYPTVSLLMGHDANMVTLLKALNVQPKELPNQIENTPIGSKIVFQKWLETRTGRHYLHVNFIYLTPSQIRNGDKVNEDNPPQHVRLQLKDCADDNGMCPWDDFMRILDELV